MELLEGGKPLLEIIGFPLGEHMRIRILERREFREIAHVHAVVSEGQALRSGGQFEFPGSASPISTQRAERVPQSRIDRKRPFPQTLRERLVVDDIRLVELAHPATAVRVIGSLAKASL